MMTTKITILGSGAMATACSILLAEHADQDVTIWARNPQNAEQMQRDRENRRLLPLYLESTVVVWFGDHRCTSVSDETAQRH